MIPISSMTARNQAREESEKMKKFFSSNRAADEWNRLYEVVVNVITTKCFKNLDDGKKKG